MIDDKNNWFGLIAGGGRLPFMVADGVHKAGLNVACVAFSGYVDNSLAQNVDAFYKVSVARPGSWIRKLKKHNISRAIMVGQVSKSHLLWPLLSFRFIPDFKAAKIYCGRLRGKDKMTDTVLCALADELEQSDIHLENSVMYCKEHLADKGLMTKNQPPQNINKDIEFGWPLAKKLGELDIGQAITVREKQIIAVEAIEGTAEMILRTGRYCKKGKWTLIKTSKPNQDMRFDVPVIGPDTIQSLADNGGKCIVIEADKTIIIDKPKTIELADKLGITIIGR